jgi:hypothetical protein
MQKPAKPSANNNRAASPEVEVIPAPPAPQK